MLTLYYLNDAITNGYKDSILDILSSICILSGVFTITSKNPIVSIIFLISLFCVISIYLIMIDISFIGISYLLVYVGAVSILFLFILMLINIRISELLNKSNNYIPLAILCIITFIYIIGQDLPNKLEINNLNIEKNEYFFNSEELKLVTSNNWERSLIDVTDISSIGNIMYTSYSILLILISLILLLSMIGSIIICIRNNRTTN